MARCAAVYSAGSQLPLEGTESTWSTWSAVGNLTSTRGTFFAQGWIRPFQGYTFENPQRPSLLVTLSISRLSNTKCCDRGSPISFSFLFLGPVGTLAQWSKSRFCNASCATVKWHYAYTSQRIQQKKQQQTTQGEGQINIEPDTDHPARWVRFSAPRPWNVRLITALQVLQES